ncbi:hypothetical protein VB713_01710 [Anabaena cylindrica UHCC 0172]|nr:hypothetical protein [Anabaena cylindrica UHCC 0172]
MSELTSVLEKIAVWYWENQPQFHSPFQPGLSHADIDTLVKDLQFPILHEIYELYKWCNGSSDVACSWNKFIQCEFNECCPVRC